MTRLFFCLITLFALTACQSKSQIDSNFLGNSTTTTYASQTDDAANMFAGGTSTGTTWDGSNSFLRLSQTGSSTNNFELDSTWAPSLGNLIGYWKFDETSGALVSDATGNYPGSWQGTVGSQWTTGKIKNGGNFDGNSNYVNVAPPPSTNNPFTIAAWVNPTSFSHGSFGGGSGITIAEGNEDGGSAGWVLGIRNNGLIWFWPSGSNDQLSTAVVHLNVWTQIVASYDGTYLRLYINGTLDSKQAMSIPQALTFFKIGAKSWITGFWQGTIDDVSLWNAALPDSSVAAIYQRQSAKYAGTFTSRMMDGLSSSANWTNFSWVPTLPFFKELPDGGTSETQANYSSQGSGLMSGIVGLWHLNDAHGSTTAIDGSNNSNDGTASAGVSFGGAGKLSTSAYFNGSNAVISTPVISLTSDSFTAQAWFRTTDTANDGKIISYGDLAFSTDTLIQTYSGQLRMCLWSSGSCVLGPFVNDGNWHHVVTVGSPTSINSYLDGNITAPVMTLPLTPLNSSLTSFISIGGSISTYYYTGDIDEVAVWNRPLGLSEIVELYRRGANRIKYQVRTCMDSTCSANPVWQGPDNTAQTYFSELNNTALNVSGAVQVGLPNILFSNFGSLSVLSDRYFQYRAIMESDDTGTACNYGSGAIWCSPELKSFTAGPMHH